MVSAHFWRVGTVAVALVVSDGLRGAEPAHAHGGAMATPERAAQAELGAQAAFDDHGVLWVVHKVSGHIAVSRSKDRGRSWGHPVLVTTAPEATDAGADARPKIALGRGGEVYLTWTRPLAKPYTGEIRFARSTDGGRTFSASQVVHRDRQEITHRFDAVAVNAKGQVFVTWIDKRDLVASMSGAAKGGTSYRGAAVYFAVSDDRGATFRGDFKAADHACECCRIALVPQSDGNVAAMWRHIFAPNLRDHALATLRADGSATAVRRVTFESWAIDACPHHGPALAFDERGETHAVWFSAAAAKRNVFYGRIRERGVEEARPVGTPLAAHPDVAVEGERVAVAWKEFADGRMRLHGMISTDGGKTWRERELAAVEGPSDHPRVLAWDGTFYVFWNTRARPLLVSPLR